MRATDPKISARSIKRACALFAPVLFLVNAPPAVPCSTFTLTTDGHFVYGRNLDWHVDSGLIVVNQRNVTKKALILPTGTRKTDGLEWTSKYGSVTFNGLGREFPNGGMNEAGLVVDIMWLNETEYPKADARREVGVLQWGQYLLDTCATVDDVLASLGTVRISEDGIPPQHYLIADRNRNTLVVDFLDGEARTYTGKDLPYAVLTNSPYDQSVQFALGFQGFGGEKPLPRTDDSLGRFVRIADAVKKFAVKDIDTVEYSFDILHDVNAGYELDQHSTVWSVVYDITNLRVHFRTNRNRSIRKIDLQGLDFSNGGPVRVWNVLNGKNGDMTKKSIPYSKEMNRQTVVKQLTNPSVAKGVGDMREMIDSISVYPEEFTRDVIEDGR
jgi:choloylglycine hydrolase